MEVAKEIKDRYEKLFYPANPVWLKCDCVDSHVNHERCRCLDTVEMNVAMLLYARLTSKYYDLSIEYKTNAPYYIKPYSVIYDEQLKNADGGYKWAICSLCTGLDMIEHDCENLESFNRIKECVTMLRKDNVFVLFVALCLYIANANSESRSVILKWFLIYDSKFLSVYVNGLKDLEMNEDDYKKYVFILTDMLETLSNRESFPMDKIMEAIRTPKFIDNYKLDNTSLDIKSIFERRIQSPKEDYISDIVLVDENGNTLISQIFEFVKLSEKFSLQSQLLEQFISIHKNIKEIVWRLRREKEDEVKRQYEMLGKFIDSIPQIQL